MKQLQAGYFLDEIYSLFDYNSETLKHLKELGKWLSHFDFICRPSETNIENEISPQLAILTNLIQRGLPTRLNIFAFDKLIEKSTILQNESNEIVIKAKFKDNQELPKLFFNALHAIDPRINRQSYFQKYIRTWKNLDSSFEENFLFTKLPKYLGGNAEYIIQSIAPQRELNQIIKDKIKVENLEQTVRTNFNGQRTDFSIEFPYTLQNGKEGIIVEIDGQQHQQREQNRLDIERDRAVTKCNWHNTVRIKTSDFNPNGLSRKIGKVANCFKDNSYIEKLNENYSNPFWNNSLLQEVYEIALIPFAIARFQRILIDALVNNKLSIDKAEWKIAVLERDVPFAKLALDDLLHLLDHLNEIWETKLILPTIVLDVFNTKEFEESRFQFFNAKTIDNFNEGKEYDILIDIAILERSTFISHVHSNSKLTYTARSVHSLDCKRNTVSEINIPYKSFAKRLEGENWEINEAVKLHLKYILQSVFRKQEFRDGQLPIINKALQYKSVIGLLPTGGGKSLTYQIAVLLQPGTCLVIDPIRSLMKDQVDGLKKNMIDSCTYINSSLKGDEKRKALKEMSEGNFQFVFVSPERLQMNEFRDKLRAMNDSDLYFNYCVIDEAHCVSEWGHDFRTAYLRLGANAIKFCKTKSGINIPLFGLTATASYDVLADVQRELSGYDEMNRLDDDAIVRAEYTKRDELQFVVNEVNIDKIGGISSKWDLIENIGKAKQQRVIELFQEAPKKIDFFTTNPYKVFDKDDWISNENKDKLRSSFSKMKIDSFDSDHFFEKNNAALVFCPHRSGFLGITGRFKDTPKLDGLFDKIENPEIKPGFFMGSGDKSDGVIIEENSFINQDKFINHDLNLMVATKAFGMGIDKENIRYTVHLNHPASIESYVQEAGRAGRDWKMAISYVLFNDQYFKLKDSTDEINLDLNINEYFHNNSFKGKEKELAVLDEFLTEIHMPDRTKLIENEIEDKLNLSLKCNYWLGGANKRLYINTENNGPLGYYNLVTNNRNVFGSVDVGTSNIVFDFIEKFTNQLNEPFESWIIGTGFSKGILEIFREAAIGDDFEITIGFSNDIQERITILSDWIQAAILKAISKETVVNIAYSSVDAKAFIKELGIVYGKLTINEYNFESLCEQRDIHRGNPIGHSYATFFNLFNGIRQSADTEKAIYRLTILGIIDDYTVNYNAQSYTLKGVKKEIHAYYGSLKKYILKYYSLKSTEIKLEQLKEIDEPNEIKKYLTFLLGFVYKEIAGKRKLALKDIHKALKDALEKGEYGNIWLKEFIDLYFNSRYARADNKTSTDEDASLFDLLVGDNKTEDKMEYVWKFIRIVHEDKKSNEIDNYKHLRGACTRLLQQQNESYTLLLLNAFTLYMLEFKSPRYFEEAEELIFNAFQFIQKTNSNITESELEEIYLKYSSHCLSHNNELKGYMDKFNFEFDFNNILIGNWLKQLKKANAVLDETNKKLN